MQVQHTRRSTKLCETSCWMLLWQFLCCPQILVAGILCCLPEQHWEKGWLALGNTGLPGALLKLTFLDANFPVLPSVQFYDLNSLIYSLLLSQFNIGDYFIAIVEKTRSGVWRAGEWGGINGKCGKCWVCRYQAQICVYVYILQCRVKKPEVSFSTACNPIRRITVFS